MYVLCTGNEQFSVDYINDQYGASCIVHEILDFFDDNEENVLPPMKLILPDDDNSQQLASITNEYLYK